MREITPLENDTQRLILKKRAVALAVEPKEDGTEKDLIEIVEFLLADEYYAIESLFISEVYPLKDLTPIPCTPAFVVGVINMRGTILSVIDLRAFFELPNKGLSDLNKVIVLNDGVMEFGILADVICGVRLISVKSLQPSLPTLTNIRADYLKGVSEDRLVVLDGGKILGDQRMIVHDDV
jgi:purine-binding chemotaxis protein CheW